MKRNVLIKSMIALMLVFQSIFAQKVGLYRYAVSEIPLSVDETVQKLVETSGDYGFQLIGKVEMKSPDNCEFKSTVIAVADSAYTEKLMKINPKTSPYLIINRINVFSDERGVHVSFVNPLSVYRTILMDDKAYNELADQLRKRIEKWIQSTVEGKIIDKEYGQFRKKGYISRTMGVVAGGKFVDKIETILVYKNKKLSDVLPEIRKAFSAPGEKYGIKLVYEYSLDDSLDIIGLNGDYLDSKSFEIVGAGSDDSRKKFKCPGIAHAAAYPLELVVRQVGNNVEVEMVEAMFRMKVYFEDAGKFAFMKNMTMPGAIADEIKDLLKKANVK